MKKLILMLVAMFTFIACSSDDGKKEEKKPNLIVGTWKKVKEIKGGKLILPESIECIEKYPLKLIFSSNEKVLLENEGYLESNGECSKGKDVKLNYVIEDKNLLKLIKKEEETEQDYIIKELTKTTLVVEHIYNITPNPNNPKEKIKKEYPPQNRAIIYFIKE